MQTLLRLVPAALLFAAACGTSGGGFSASDIKASAPAGTINNMPWTLSKATIKNDGTNLSVNLFADTSVADCADFQDSSSTVPYVLFTMPAQMGERPLQLSLSDFNDPNNQTVTFVTPPSNNNIATDGIINVTALSSSSVTLGLVAEAGQDQVNGTVTTQICP